MDILVCFLFEGNRINNPVVFGHFYMLRRGWSDELFRLW